MNVVKDRTGISVNNLQIDGGASKNNLLAQMIADYTQASVSRPNSVEATALGGAEMALIGAGLAKQEDFASVMDIDRTFTPQMDDEKRTKIMRDGNARENVPENGWLNKRFSFYIIK